MGLVGVSTSMAGLDCFRYIINLQLGSLAEFIDLKYLEDAGIFLLGFRV